MGIRQQMVSRLARNGEHEKQRASIKGLQIGSPQAIDSDGLLLALQFSLTEIDQFFARIPNDRRNRPRVELAD